MKSKKNIRDEQERLRAQQIKDAWTQIMDPMGTLVKCFPEYGSTKIPTSETVKLLEVGLLYIYKASQTLRDRPSLRIV